MTAEEARELTKIHGVTPESKIKKELTLCIESIREQARKGNSAAFCHRLRPPEEVSKKLEDLGFTVRVYLDTINIIW